MASSRGSGAARVRVAAAAALQGDVARPVGGGPHSAGGVGPNSTTDGVAERRREVGDAGVAAEHAPARRRRARRARRESVRPASTAPAAGPRARATLAASRRSPGQPVTTHAPPGARPRRGRPRPSAPPASGARRSPRRGGRPSRRRPRAAPSRAAPQVELAPGRRGCPAASSSRHQRRDLVLVRPPRRAVPGTAAPAKAISRRGRVARSSAVALRPAAVQVDGDVGAARRPAARAAPCRRDRVDRAGERGQRRERRAAPRARARAPGTRAAARAAPGRR